MVVKTLYYLMAIFVAIFLSVLMQDPYFLDLSKMGSTEARVEMHDVVDYELNANEVKRVTKAQSIMRYKNEDVANKPQMLLKRDDLIYVLEGDRGVLVEEVATFQGNVAINRSDGASFVSDSLSYDWKKSLITSNTPFTLKEKDLHVKGDVFSYSFKEKRITAQKIYANFNLEEI